MVEVIRRSGRAKRQVTSIYDEAKKQIEERESISSRESRKSLIIDEEESEPEEDDGEMTSDSESVDGEPQEDHEENKEGGKSDDDDEEDTVHPKSKNKIPKKKTPVKTRKPSSKKVQVRIGEAKSKSPKAPISKVSSANSKRGSQNALAALAKKVLEPGETTDNSLVASLLYTYKTENSEKRTHSADDNRTMYTAQLERVARKVVEGHKDDTSRTQVALLNLLFRSVGGTTETILDDDKILEDMDSEQWGQIVTDLVDDMRYTPADRVLLCADPDGAVHAAAIDGKLGDVDIPLSVSASGAREYRKVYEEFWFVLGTVALSEGYTRSGDSKDEGDTETKDESFITTNRFDTEILRDLILRVSELVTVGQPDVRAAAMIAAMQMGLAVLNRSAEIKAKLEVATRQFNATKAGKSGHRKAEALGIQIDSLKRTKEDLEELVIGNIMQGVFMHRYRDSNMHIRAFALESLSKMTLMRPDIFLGDKYLKYFGWMLSDKCACVRQSAIAGLAAPFKALVERTNGTSRNRVVSLDVERMQNVISKFLLRLVDCVIDVNVKVQEQAMALLLILARRGFMDEMEDDRAWSQINVRSLASDTSAIVRRDALYFVIEQLEAWDEQEQSQDKKWSKDTHASLVQSTEILIVQKLDSLAAWIAHSLTNGEIPLDKIRIELVDHVVESLRAMPEHRDVITNWSAIIRAIGDDGAVASEGDGNRIEVAKQRVLVQMLACAAHAEVGSVAEADFLYGDLDDDLVEILKMKAIPPLESGTKKKKPKQSSGMAHEILSVALLQALPGLMSRFKTDPSILGSLSILPRYLLPAIFSLPQRKTDFIAVVKNMTETFLESSNEEVISNIAQSLKFLAQGDHVRSKDVHLQLQSLASSLSNRLVELLDLSTSMSDEGKLQIANKRKKKKKKVARSSKGQGQPSRADQRSLASSDKEHVHDKGEQSAEQDIEYSIFLCLKRLRILSKRMCFVDLLKIEDSLSIGALCNKIVEAISNRLKNRQVITSDEEAIPTFAVPEIWKDSPKGIHLVVAKQITEGLDFLLAVTLWSRKAILHQDDDESDEDIDDLPVVLQRDKIVALVSLCFEQFLPLNEGVELEDKYSNEHIAFSDHVQSTAAQVMSDLRALFPREWADATSPSLRAMALTDDQQLAAGFVRYFRSMEEHLRLAETEGGLEDVDRVRQMLLPFARSLGTNWKCGNRREAGYALAHITGSGPEASKIVAAMARVAKKIDSVRLLETQMACLRTSFEEWLNTEPEEPESDRPTDEEMAAFDDAERKHNDAFQLMEQQASRLSQSLGVGKLSDAKLKNPILGFVREGVRYAFSTDIPGEDPLMPGGRLTFLLLLCKYATWIRRNNEQRAALLEDLDTREDDLRCDPEFSEVLHDDLVAIEQFRRALGFPTSDPKLSSPRSIAASENSVGLDSGDERSVGSGSTGPSPTSSKIRSHRSRGSSMGSVRSSRPSMTQSSLSPLPEEDGLRLSPDDDEDLYPSPEKRCKVSVTQRSTRSSNSSNRSGSSIGRSSTIEEASGEDSDMSETHYID